jgi:hypothetical protein
MQVVKPSVSLAAVLHGAAFTAFFEISSSPTWYDPGVVLGSIPVAGGGAAPLS